MNIFKNLRLFMMSLVILAIGTGNMPVMAQGRTGEIRLIPGDPESSAAFGRSVAIDGDLVAVGASDDGTAGAAYVFKHQGQSYIQEAELVAPDTTGLAEFGRTVAIQGNSVFVGARFAEVGDFERAGAVYVFRKNQESWEFAEKIVSPDPQNEDNFGRALAVQGGLMVVTARKEDAAASDVGAAYVYLFRNGNWTYETKLTASDPVSKAYFGQSVAIQGDNIAIGARNADPSGAGAVYLFHNDGNTWTQFAKVTPEDGQKDDHFAFSIAISGDVMTVGARRADLSGAKDAGAAYVYAIEEDSVDFIAKLTAKDAAANDQFGQSVAIAGDTIAVGAWKDDASLGSIYLFRQTDGKWIETGKIMASDGVPGDEFGYSLAGFGSRLVTGAHFADSRSGAAYVIQIKP